MTRRHPGRVLAAKVGWAVVAAAVAMALSLVEADLWTVDSGTRLTLILAAAAIGVAATVLAAFGEFLRQRGEARADHARAILVPLAFVLQDMTRIDVRDLGIAAYLRQRPWWWPFRERLCRVYRERARLASASGVRWRPGKGVIGRCVELGQDVCVDLAGLDDLLADVTPEQWADLDGDLTLGLTVAEHRRLRGKYGSVLATPILVEYPTGTRVVGGLTVDGPPGSYDLLASRQVRAQVASAAELLADQLF